MAQGIMMFRSLAEAMLHGYSIAERTDYGYLVRTRTKHGDAYAMVVVKRDPQPMRAANPAR